MTAEECQEGALRVVAAVDGRTVGGWQWTGVVDGGGGRSVIIVTTAMVKCTAHSPLSSGYNIIQYYIILYGMKTRVYRENVKYVKKCFA